MLCSDITFRATSSELDTAKALGSSSPRNKVTIVSRAVMKPRLSEGKMAETLATNNAVLCKDVGEERAHLEIQ